MSIIYINPFQFAAPALGGWTPADITTALWLDAADASTITESGGAVSEWRDKSGNGRNVAQATAALQPSLSTFNSKQALSFSSDIMQSTASITTGTYAGQLNVCYVATRLNNGGSLITERAGARVACSQWIFLGNAYYISSDGQNDSSNHSISVTTFNKLASTGCVVVHEHLAGIRDKLFLNGTQESVTSGSASNISGSTAYFRIGAREGSVAQNWDGLICEIIVTLSTQSLSDRQKIEGYLAHKWGLTANLPADHPYKTAVPVP